MRIPNNMKIMSVDIGLARTGLAVCDENMVIASPVKVISETYEPKLLAAISQTAHELEVKRIVVGLPLNMDGSKGERAFECERIAGKIAALSGIETVLWDERCTTVSAHNILNITNTRGKKRKQVVDAVAAVLILEGYLPSIK